MKNVHNEQTSPNTNKQKYHQSFKLRKNQKEYKHDLMYHAKCLKCNEDYINETGGRVQNCVDEYACKLIRNGY